MFELEDNNFGPSTLIVNGRLTADVIIFSDMIVGNNASIFMKTAEYGIGSSGATLIGIKKDSAPTLTLGDEVKFITPENAEFINANSDDNGYYVAGVAISNAINRPNIIEIGKKDKFAITVTKTGEGTITPSDDTVEGYEQNDKEFTFTPATGYEISDVKVDGTSIGKVASYTFSNVTEAHTLDVTFEKITYTVTTSKTGEGTISPENPTAKYGEDIKLKFKADTDYKISDVKVNGTSVGALDYYEFKAISSNATVEVVFTLKPVATPTPSTTPTPENPNNSVPNTGDNNTTQIFFGAMIISVLGVVILLKKRKSN